MMPPATPCFNPCCAGCGFQTHVTLQPFRSMSCFNPCCAGCGFQTFKHLGNGRAPKVSILVVLDVGFRRSPTRSTRGTRPSFNPCCAGCGFQTRLQATGNRPNQGFNPCCAGCGFQTRRIQPRNGGRVVSILVVLDVGFRHHDDDGDGIMVYVSILVVLDVGFRRSGRRRSVQPRGFQSLLCWMWVSDLGDAKRWLEQNYVSILVVLDVGFRHTVP